MKVFQAWGLFRTYLWIAWRNLMRNRRRSILTFTTIALGLVVMIFSDGLMAGSEMDILYNLVRLQGGHVEIRVKPERERPLGASRLRPTELDALIGRLEAHPSVDGVSPRIILPGLATNNRTSRSVQVVAVEPEREKRVNSIVFQGSPQYLDATGGREALVGKPLAEALGLQTGDHLDLVIQGPAGATNVTFKVQAVYNTNFGEYDKSFVFIPLDQAQRLLFKGATNVAVLLNKPEEAPQLARTIEGWAESAKIETPYEVVPWQEAQAAILDALAAKNTTMILLGGIIVLIAAFGVLNTMLMSVYERVREIGVMMALGTKAREVVLLFLLEGFLMGAMGGFAGAFLGVALTGWMSTVGISLGNYSGVSNIPISNVLYAQVIPSHVVVFALFVVLVAVASSLYPALSASRQQPAQALRYV